LRTRKVAQFKPENIRAMGPGRLTSPAKRWGGVVLGLAVDLGY